MASRLMSAQTLEQDAPSSNCHPALGDPFARELFRKPASTFRARALALATIGFVLATGPAICQTVGTAAAVNPAASSAGKILTLGSPIIHKERVRTDTGGSVQLLFIDRTTMSIGPNSDVLIDEYVFD